MAGEKPDDKVMPRRLTGRRSEDECQHCYKDKVDNLVPVVFTLVGKVSAMLATNVVVICLTLLVGIIAYMGRDAQADNIQNNKTLITENTKNIATEKKENQAFRVKIEKSLDRQNNILISIQKKLDR